MVIQTCVVHPRHLGMVFQVLRHFDGVFANAVHAQRQGLDALQDLEGVHGGQGCPHVAQGHHTGTGDVGRRAKRFGVDHTVVADVGLVQALEASLVLSPGELAAVDNGTADAGTVATQVFGEGMHHDVRPVLEWAAQRGAGHRVVYDQRHSGSVGDLGQRCDVGHIPQRVAHRLAIHRLGAAVDQSGKAGWVARVGKAHRDALLGQRVGKQVVGAAVQRTGRHDVVTRFGNGLDGVGDGGHARGHRQRSNTAFQGRQPRFQHAIGGVHDAAVDVAGHLQVEQVGPVLGVVKRVGHRLVDGDGHGLGGRVGGVAAMNGDGFELHVISC